MLGLVAGPVIEAIARLEFEDGLRTKSSLNVACTLVAAAPSPESILHHLGVQVGHGGSVVVIRTPVRPNSNSAEFRTWVVLNYSSYVVLG